ncbi:MAG: hypothetical protein AB7D51_05755 [Desulfovibrionaceae bacterium]|jgi:hypothetical protein
MEPKKEIITATGVLYPVFDVKGGAVTGVILSTTSEVEYVITGERFMNELISLCQEEVRVRGRRSMVDGRWTLEPMDYEVPMRDIYEFYDDIPNYDDADTLPDYY